MTIVLCAICLTAVVFFTIAFVGFSRSSRRRVAGRVVQLQSKPRVADRLAARQFTIHVINERQVPAGSRRAR